MSLLEDNRDIRLQNKNELVELQNFYVNATIDNLPKLVIERKEEIVNKLVKFQETRMIKTEDEDGIPKIIEKPINPYLVSTYFFKSINPLSNVEPEYSSEKLSIVWELYMYLVGEVNMSISPFTPTLSHFSKFAGISLSTLRNYRNSPENGMKILCSKIYDECFDSNVNLAQNKMLSEKSTIYRMKSENEVSEKTQPTVNISYKVEDINMADINTRINDYKNFSKGKIKNGDING